MGAITSEVFLWFCSNLYCMLLITSFRIISIMAAGYSRVCSCFKWFSLLNDDQRLRPNSVADGPCLKLSKVGQKYAIQNVKKSSILVHGLFHKCVNIGINTRNLAQGRLLIKSFLICFARRQKSSFIRGLICINTRWPLYDFPIITLCLGKTNE